MSKCLAADDRVSNACQLPGIGASRGKMVNTAIDSTKLKSYTVSRHTKTYVGRDFEQEDPFHEKAAVHSAGSHQPRVGFSC